MSVGRRTFGVGGELADVVAVAADELLQLLNEGDQPPVWMGSDDAGGGSGWAESPGEGCGRRVASGGSEPGGGPGI